MVHLSNAGWHCWIMYCFWGRFTWRFFTDFPPGRTLKQCRTHQSWSNVRMVGVTGSWPLPPGIWRSWSAVLAWMVPRGRSGMLELHVVKTACDLDVSRSPFWGCVTTSWCLCGFSGPNDAMPGIGSGSTDSRHQFLAEMPEAKVSMTSLHCRLVSKHRQVMLPCTGEDHWCMFSRTGQWGRHRNACLCYGWLGSYYLGALTCMFSRTGQWGRHRNACLCYGWLGSYYLGALTCTMWALRDNRNPVNRNTNMHSGVDLIDQFVRTCISGLHLCMEAWPVCVWRLVCNAEKSLTP